MHSLRGRGYFTATKWAQDPPNVRVNTINWPLKQKKKQKKKRAHTIIWYDAE